MELVTNPPGLVAPNAIGKYRVIHRLGGGSFGEVFFCRADGSNSPLAVKILRERFPCAHSATVLRRFQSEAYIANSIEHPGIVKVIDAGYDDSQKLYFYAMEYLPGKPFNRYIDAVYPFSSLAMRAERRREIANLGYQIASAMSVAHASGIIHRDLKPDNVLVVTDPWAVKQRRIKILDFGIAKFPPTLLASAAMPVNFTPQWTFDGALMGTPPYMAPELYGQAHTATGAADVYALGIMLWEALCGVDPEDRTAEIPALQSADPSTGPEWVRLIARMTDEDAAQRPSMSEVGPILQALAQLDNDFAQAVLAWEQSGRTVHATGAELQKFLGWAKDKVLTAGEMEFLRASSEANHAFEQAEADARMAKQREEAETRELELRRRLRSKRTTVVALTASFVIALVSLACTTIFWREANAKGKEYQKLVEKYQKEHEGRLTSIQKEVETENALNETSGRLQDLVDGKVALEDQKTKLEAILADVTRARNYLGSANDSLKKENDRLTSERDRAEEERAAAERQRDKADEARIAAQRQRERALDARDAAERDLDRALDEKAAAQRQRDKANDALERANLTIDDLKVRCNAQPQSSFASPPSIPALPSSPQGPPPAQRPPPAPQRPLQTPYL